MTVVPIPRRERSAFASWKDPEARRFDGANEAPGELVALDRALGEAIDEALVDDVDRELARDLAGRGAAHAVAHGEEGALRADGW